MQKSVNLREINHYYYYYYYRAFRAIYRNNCHTPIHSSVWVYVDPSQSKTKESNSSSLSVNISPTLIESPIAGTSFSSSSNGVTAPNVTKITVLDAAQSDIVPVVADAEQMDLSTPTRVNKRSRQRVNSDNSDNENGIAMKETRYPPQPEPEPELS